MTHIQELVIHRFRNLRNLNLAELGQFNLFVGSNNSGKTSVLEAIELYCHPLDIAKFIETSRSRDKSVFPVRVPLLESIYWMFPVHFNAIPGGTKERIYIFQESLMVILGNTKHLFRR